MNSVETLPFSSGISGFSELFEAISPDQLLFFHAITPNFDTPDMSEIALKNEPTLKIEPNEPTLPIEKADPNEPMLNMEFFDPILKSEFSDATLNRELDIGPHYWGREE